MNLLVRKSQNLKGEIRMPRSKTHSFRALILASLANGKSIIREPKLSNDWHEAVKAMRLFGAKIEEIRKNIYRVEGVAGKLQTPNDIINVGNSGTMLFFTSGVAATCPGWTVITGDQSIRNLRTVSKNLFRPFKKLGVAIISTKNDGMAPLLIKGKVNGGKALMDGTGCQPVFSVLIASALSKQPVDIYVKNSGETAYIDLLLYWFDKVGIKYENENHTHYHFPGNNPPIAFTAIIPFEWSAPSYPLLAAVLTSGSKITIKGMDETDPYGDKFVLDVLIKMGADIKNKNSTLTAKTSQLHGIEIDMNIMPDQVPTVAVAACFAKGKTIINNAQTARWKECDRISAICNELKKMGAKVIEKKDGLIINQDGTWKLKGRKVNGYKDHRMVLSLAVAGLNSSRETIISDAETLEKSFETFVTDMQKAGANLKLI
ncbi:3-phosphoshikimate 1-carboxyvinyltransferase [Candidatus Gottesmanbacteria bacterium RIFCSPLOWO2_02_FULL_38_8]|uniref:3-phosphoshikimate 1-carboxyvinyltransferase n=1 Tax=Candidatus Gottesmanbacteria bacterium RIFCSPLOWO2_02_FULL_38_8 TaxID=1798397 RepID=A0A1F6B2A7_9BACT|nr:MAG: 3-phosphoshikimate 1-carboxyvinyltransferase [Candidatus Gottesmanbacteria bacterium RIFCSPLOWO2_02_FULL_38_8]